jgi:hypothetical protein
MLLTIAAVGACGGNGANGGGVDGGGGSAPGGGDTTVNGVPASQFYGQFAYATTGTYMEGASAFSAQSNGVDAFLVDFFLMPGNQLVLYYGEGAGDVEGDQWSLNLLMSTEKKRTGTWKVDGVNLVLDSFMTCQGLTFNGGPAVSCTLNSAIVTPDAVGQSGLFRKSLYQATPDDSQFSDYQP